MWLRTTVPRLLACVLLAAAGCSGNYQPGDFVPTARQAQFHGHRTHWHDVLGRHCPKFGESRTVVLPLAQPTGFLVADDYKLQLSFDGDRFLTPWLPLIGRRAPQVPYLEVSLVRSGDRLAAVRATMQELDAADLQKHKTLVQEWAQEGTWPKHLVVRYRWITRNEEDEERGLLVLFAAGAVAALLLGLNAARGHRQKLRQFLTEMTGEENFSFPLEKGD